MYKKEQEQDMYRVKTRKKIHEQDVPKKFVKTTHLERNCFKCKDKYCKA